MTWAVQPARPKARRALRALLLAAFGFLAQATQAAPAQAFPARVYHVHDGDTVSLGAAGGTFICRLAGIDAPEEPWPGRWTRQPYADRSRAALAALILGRIVGVEDMRQRSYGRRVCVIRIAGMDVNRRMVALGAAWAATRFEPRRERDPLMPALERRARRGHLGLWAAVRPMPPWRWRWRRERG